MSKAKALEGVFGTLLDRLLRRSSRTPAPTTSGSKLAQELMPHPALTARRLQHGTKNLTAAGVLPNWSGKKSPAMIAELLGPILHSPQRVFDHELGGSGVTGHLGVINGRQVAVFVYKDGPYAGELASSFVPTPAQLKKWGML